MLTARWQSRTFLHWPCHLEEVQTLLPDGLRVDVFGGAAWVGVTPFRVASVKALGMVPVPGPDFPETDVRIYVRLPNGDERPLRAGDRHYPARSPRPRPPHERGPRPARPGHLPASL
ncbi:DUF2071 domain-containing protein [Streptomyces sp. GD-15H]|uniref:DUF2071 domain-containing protein n=1 Tax=Streptomyces sp. GD-15H TaxID=3129112 RepID=UPI0038736750